MPKQYEEMNRAERTKEYNRLAAVLKKQEGEKSKRPGAIQITKGRMRHLHYLHEEDKKNRPGY